MIVNIARTDYAVNAMAELRYPQLQRIWNSSTYPETSIDRIIVSGLTLSSNQPGFYTQR